MNAANEIAVASFLEERLRFDKIPVVIQRTLKETGKPGKPVLEDIMTADKSARRHAAEVVDQLTKFVRP